MKAIHLFRHSNTYRRMFLHNYILYTATALLLLLMAGLLICRQDFAACRESALQAASNLAYYADDQLAACQKLAASVGQNERLLSLYSNAATDLDFSLLDSTTLFAAQHDLVSAKALNRFAATLNVYLYNKQFVISDNGTMTLESFYQSIFNMSPSIFSEYLRPISSGSFLFLPKGAVEETDTPQHPLLALSVINGNGTRYGNLFILLDERQMREDIRLLLNNQDMEFYLFDSAGRPIVTGGPTEPDNSSALFSCLSTDDHFQSSTGSLSGWIGFTGYSKSFLEKRFRSILWTVCGLSILLLILGLPLAHALCRKSYAPIRELASIVSSSGHQAADRVIEYEALKSAISSIFEDKSLLEEQLLIYRPLLVNSLLLELLEGSLPRTAILPGLQRLGVEFHYPSHVCCCILTDCASQEFLMSLALEIRNPHTGCLYVTYRKHLGIFLISAPTPQDCMQACSRLLDLLTRITPNAFLGVSDTADRLEQLGMACQQSRRALEYLPPDPSCRGIFWKQLEASGALELTAPSCLKSLPASFGAGQAAEARNNLTLYFQSICCCGPVKKEHLTYARDQLLAAVSRAEKETGGAWNQDPLRSWTPDQPGALDELKHLALLACDRLEQNSQEQKEQQLQNSAQTLMDYLTLHLYDEDLSLSKLSEAFQMSESSISRRIKQITDYNFLDYVNRKRIEYACSLLAETDMSVNEVARTAGYESDITFRRLFKKYSGITPGDYRRQKE